MRRRILTCTLASMLLLGVACSSQVSQGDPPDASTGEGPSQEPSPILVPAGSWDQAALAEAQAAFGVAMAEYAADVQACSAPTASLDECMGYDSLDSLDEAFRPYARLLEETLATGLMPPKVASLVRRQVDATRGYLDNQREQGEYSLACFEEAGVEATDAGWDDASQKQLRRLVNCLKGAADLGIEGFRLSAEMKRLGDELDGLGVG